MTRRHDLTQDWQFRRVDDPNDGMAVRVDLPHSPFAADLNGRNHWFGLSEYRRAVEWPTLGPDEQCVLWIGAAMQKAQVFVGTTKVGQHSGGFLPFEVDLTSALRGPTKGDLIVLVDNRYDPDIPPGKPFEELDFCWYGGLYRDAELRVRPCVHITDPIAANEVAGGGVFLRTQEASSARAVVVARTHVRNAAVTPRSVRVQVSLRQDGREVATETSTAVRLPGGGSEHVELSIAVTNPALWSHATPLLHDVVVRVLDLDGSELDQRKERFGIRTISFSRSNGFVVNGRRVRVRGTNRHQEFPRVGYAAPRAAQYRDARRIKEAGFDYVRLAHYPQSPDFLRACDELGLYVMNCIPGWQYLGSERFRSASLDGARRLIRRDRNHPCVVLWELSLNETAMDDAFIAQLKAIGHEEYPGDQMYTCGWIDRYDVYSHSRQHGEIHRWQNGDKALVIAEYGDWEFFARNEGFDQKSGAGIFDRWSTARQFRSDGERGLRQQVFNHMVALNDTLASPAVLDGQWAMFDYARGYDGVRAAVGVMDIFRLPKFSYYLYRSQRDPNECGAGWMGGPMVFIASHWTAISNLRIPVFSNCDEVELRLNGVTIARTRAGQTALTQHLPHPPFFFDLPQFKPGVLDAIGYIGGQPRASHSVATPGTATQLELIVDEAGISAQPGQADVLLAHASWRDARGTLAVDEGSEVQFTVIGDAELIGPNRVAAEAGIASCVIRLPAYSKGFVLHASPTATEKAPAVKLSWSRHRDADRHEPAPAAQPAGVRA